MSLQNATLATTIEHEVDVVATTTGNLRDQIPKYIIYIVEGLLLGVSNLLIFITITTVELMRRRKEYIIVAGLAFADGMSGWAMFYAGVYRSYLVYIGEECTLVSRRACLLKPHNLIWFWDETMQPLMLLIISIDRLFAVAMPIRHYTMSDVYAKTLVFGAYGLVAVQTAVGAYMTWPLTEPISPQVCFTNEGAHTDFYHFYAATMISYAIASVILYVTIIPIHAIKRKPATTTRQMERNIKKQRQLTCTLGISCVFTLLLNVIPSVVILVADVNGWDETTITPSAYIMYELNPIINFGLFISRHSDIRMAMLHRVGLHAMANRVTDISIQRKNRPNVNHNNSSRRDTNGS